MLQKFKEIVSAWIIANNPTREQKLLAENRFKICNTCPYKKVVTEKIGLGTICAECGCPLSKKIFSTEFNPCPQKKWQDVDTKFMPATQKKSKTIL